MGNPVSASEAGASERERLDQLAGFTGLGWTTSILLFLTTTISPGSGPVEHIVAEPAVFLYLGVVLFLVTLELDRRGSRRSPPRGFGGPQPSGSRPVSADTTRTAHDQAVASSRISGGF